MLFIPQNMYPIIYWTAPAAIPCFLCQLSRLDKCAQDTDTQRYIPFLR